MHLSTNDKLLFKIYQTLGIAYVNRAFAPDFKNRTIAFTIHEVTVLTAHMYVRQ